MPPKRPKSRSKSAVEADRVARYQEEERIRLEKEALIAELERKAAVVTDLIERRVGERTVVKELFEKRVEERDAAHKTIADEQEWQRYTSCPTLPTPDDHAGVNTFLTTLIETEIAKDFELETEMGKLDEAVVMCEMLSDHGDSLGERSTNAEVESCDALTQLAYTTIMSKLDAIIEVIVQYADDRLTIPNQDLFLHSLDSSVKLLLWGNLTKDPALEVAEFKVIKEEVQTEDDEFEKKKEDEEREREK
eukprot:m.921 g.921  ORF g.921 m.921 type:complete len:249 (+) comp460_c1_seq1:153-899(+)